MEVRTGSVAPELRIDLDDLPMGSWGGGGGARAHAFIRDDFSITADLCK